MFRAYKDRSSALFLLTLFRFELRKRDDTFICVYIFKTLCSENVFVLFCTVFRWPLFQFYLFSFYSRSVCLVFFSLSLFTIARLHSSVHMTQHCRVYKQYNERNEINKCETHSTNAHTNSKSSTIRLTRTLIVCAPGFPHERIFCFRLTFQYLSH